MTETKISLYDKFQDKFNDYYFNFPGRIPLRLHQSHLNDSALFVIRVIGFVYISILYFWYALQDFLTFSYNIIYLTMLGFLGTWLYFTLTLQDYFINSKPELSKNLKKLTEIVYQISLCVQVVITLGFWVLLFPPMLKRENIKHSYIVLQGYLHSIPLLFLVIDLFFNSFSFPSRHLSLLVIFMIIYFFLNMTYSLAIEPVYAPIPWKNLLSYIIGVGFILLTILVHFLARALFNNWKLKNIEKRQAQSSDFNQIQDQEEINQAVR